MQFKGGYMGAPKGNNYKMKWKTSEERKRICELVCEHIASGLSQDSFPEADWDTVERYIRDFPDDFPAEKLKMAARRNRLYWETRGICGMNGDIPGFNATAWIFNMKNRFKDWNDTRQTQLTGHLEVNNKTTIDPALLSDQQLEALRSITQSLLSAPIEDGEWDDVEE